MEEFTNPPKYLPKNTKTKMNDPPEKMIVLKKTDNIYRNNILFVA